MNVTKHAAKRPGFLRRCTKYLSCKYEAYIRSLLEFRFPLMGRSSSVYIKSYRRKESFPSNCTKVTNQFDSLENWHQFGAVTLSYRYFYGQRSSEILRIRNSILVVAQIHGNIQRNFHFFSISLSN